MIEDRTYVVVDGSYGIIGIDEYTGDVVKYVPRNVNDARYSNITRFDVAEFRSVYGDELPILIDILDIGCWEGAEYYPPSQHHREKRKGYAITT